MHAVQNFVRIVFPMKRIMTRELPRSFSSHAALHTDPSSVFKTCEDAGISPSAISASSALRIMK